MEYNPKEIETKWQKYWQKNNTFKAENNSNKPKYYVLDMFPYPSGAGLHVGHPLGYIASDIYSRYKRLLNFNVLHPIGYDSFGLPAEQYAIQTGQHPAITTKTNIEGGKDKQGNLISGYENQMKRLGFSFDWSREVRTSSPNYYRWTQWIFIQLFESYYDISSNKAVAISELIAKFESEGNKNVNAHTDYDKEFTAADWNAFSEEEKSAILLEYRIAYLAEAEVNWCPELGTVLANDEVVNGVSERGGYPVIRKKMTQWMMRITAYSERLLQGLETIDWSEALKDQQRNWVGKSKGAQLRFKVENQEDTITVFTTRPDTVFGVSFMTLAPEHPLVQKITTDEYREKVNKYVEGTAKKSERERMADVQSISGQFTGAYAIHPFTTERIPIWIGDYVLASYGFGAVMAVPCGDERDYKFAKHFDLPIPNIFNQNISEEAFAEKEGFVYENSDFLNGLDYKKGTEEIISIIEQRGIGKGTINYRLRDAVFSRQRYWGEPVPIYYKNGIPTPIPSNCLPLELPEIDEYLPTETGEPPLGRAKNWAWNEPQNRVVSVEDIDEKNVFPIELNTMPGWAGSSWYWMRYMDPDNEEKFASTEALDYWQNVDLYIGGSEHATGHLLYARFWNKFLKDLGFAPTEEPFQKLINQGMILGNSAFVFRDNDQQIYISADQVSKPHLYQKIHVELSLIDESDDSLNIEAFKNWRVEFKNANVENGKDGKFYVHREVEKMSKSKYNVLNPDDIADHYGADCLRMYEMFLGPLEQSKPWNTQGLSGVSSFLKKFWRLYFQDSIQENGKVEASSTISVSNEEPTAEEYKILHQTIKKVKEDLEDFSFNTSVSTFMIATNELHKIKCNKREILAPLVVLISPYAPHIAEELWQLLGHNESVSFASFPTLEDKYLAESSKEYPISFNGKMRFTMELSLDLTQEEVEKKVLDDERTQKYLEGRSPKKIIYVPGKVINLVG